MLNQRKLRSVAKTTWMPDTSRGNQNHEHTLQLSTYWSRFISDPWKYFSKTAKQKRLHQSGEHNQGRTLTDSEFPKNGFFFGFFYSCNFFEIGSGSRDGKNFATIFSNFLPPYDKNSMGGNLGGCGGCGCGGGWGIFWGFGTFRKFLSQATSTRFRVINFGPSGRMSGGTWKCILRC